MKLVGAVLLVALVGCSHKSHSIAKDEARKLLIDRNWIDKWPTSRTDKLHVFRFVPQMGGGVFQDRTIYKGQFELFQFMVDGDQIQFDLPEKNERVISKFRIDKVDGPHPFDLKLTVENDPRGPHEYYGILEENDPDGHVLEQKLHAVK